MYVQEFVVSLLAASVALHFLCLVFTGVPGPVFNVLKDSKDTYSQTLAAFFFETTSLFVAFGLMRIRRFNTTWKDTVCFEIATSFMSMMSAVIYAKSLLNISMSGHLSLSIIVNCFTIGLDVISLAVVMLKLCFGYIKF